MSRFLPHVAPLSVLVRIKYFGLSHSQRLQSKCTVLPVFSASSIGFISALSFLTPGAKIFCSEKVFPPSVLRLRTKSVGVWSPPVRASTTARTVPFEVTEILGMRSEERRVGKEC